MNFLETNEDGRLFTSSLLVGFHLRGGKLKVVRIAPPKQPRFDEPIDFRVAAPQVTCEE